MLKLSTQISRNKKSIVNEVSKFRRKTAIQPSVSKLDRKELLNSINIYQQENSQGQGDVITPIRMETRIGTEEEKSNIEMYGEGFLDRFTSNQMFYPGTRLSNYQDSAISEQEDEDSIS